MEEKSNEHKIEIISANLTLYSYNSSTAKPLSMEGITIVLIMWSQHHHLLLHYPWEIPPTYTIEKKEKGFSPHVNVLRTLMVELTWKKTNFSWKNKDVYTWGKVNWNCSRCLAILLLFSVSLLRMMMMRRRFGNTKKILKSDQHWQPSTSNADCWMTLEDVEHGFE